MFLLNLYRKYRERKLYSRLGKRGRRIFIGFPIMISKPELLYMDDFTLLLNGANLILNSGRFIVGKYTGIASGLTVVTDNHTPTVGVPFYFTGHFHLNDRNKDVIIKEDCWLGTNVTLLPGAIINRGGVVAACALVNKEFPPYAVIAGIPAKIIGVKFSCEEIIEHEMKLYEPKARLSVDYLKELFNTVYKDKKIMNHARLDSKAEGCLKHELQSEGFTYPKANWYEM